MCCIIPSREMSSLIRQSSLLVAEFACFCPPFYLVSCIHFTPLLVNLHSKPQIYTYCHVVMNHQSMKHSHRGLLPKWLANSIIHGDLEEVWSRSWFYNGDHLAGKVILRYQRQWWINLLINALLSLYSISLKKPLCNCRQTSTLILGAVSVNKLYK